jgi:hypothetical protein
MQRNAAHRTASQFLAPRRDAAHRIATQLNAT